MSIDATAEALATETAMPAEVASEALTEDQELEAAFDRINDEPVELEEPEEQPEESEAEDQTPDEPEDEEADEAEAAEEPAEKVEAPTELPKAIRDKWADIPEEARDAILTSQREMSRKLSDQGRQMQGIAPIRDVLVEMAQDTPELLDMRPEQVAREIKAFRDNVIKPLETDPVNTIMRVIKERGLAEPLMQAMQGQAPQEQSMQTNQLLQKIDVLERKLAQATDPDYIGGIAQQYSVHAETANQISAFAADKEHWDTVSQPWDDNGTSPITQAISLVKGANPDLPAKDILERAYDLAVSQFVPEASKATQKEAAPEAAPAADPAKTEAAIKAKSVNVKGTSTSKPRKMTEEEELARIFDKMKE